MTEVASVGITLPLTILTLSVIITTSLQLNNIFQELIDGENQRIVRAAFPVNEELDFVSMDKISGPSIYRFIVANDYDRIKIKAINYSNGNLEDFLLKDENGKQADRVKQLLTVYSDKYFKAELVNIEDDKGRADYYIQLTQEVDN